MTQTPTDRPTRTTTAPCGIPRDAATGPRVPQPRAAQAAR